jgi:hypothetical protein
MQYGIGVVGEEVVFFLGQAQPLLTDVATVDNDLLRLDRRLAWVFIAGAFPNTDAVDGLTRRVNQG